MDKVKTNSNVPGVPGVPHAFRECEGSNSNPHQYVAPSNEERQYILTITGQRESIVREKDRQEITGLGRTTWWSLEKQGIAPKRIVLGTRHVGWKMSDLLWWIEQQQQVVA